MCLDNLYESAALEGLEKTTLGIGINADSTLTDLNMKRVFARANSHLGGNENTSTMLCVIRGLIQIFSTAKEKGQPTRLPFQLTDSLGWLYPLRRIGTTRSSARTMFSINPANRS